MDTFENAVDFINNHLGSMEDDLPSSLANLVNSLGKKERKIEIEGEK